MKHTTILAAIAATLIIPGSFGQMHIEREFAPWPDLALIFGPSQTQIKDGIREFVGEPLERPKKKLADNIERVNRPCPYTKTETVLPCEEWKSTYWVVECEFVYDEGLSTPTNECKRCGLKEKCPRFILGLWQVRELTNDTIRCQCMRAYRIEKVRYAQIRNKAVETKYVNKADRTRVTRKTRAEVEVLNVVTEAEFYDRFFDEEKSRKKRFDEWVESEREKHREG